MPSKASRKSAVRIRTMTTRDVPAVVELNKVSYPTLAEDNVVWRPEHLESHLRTFPRGLILAVAGNRIVGAASSLVVSLGSDPHRDLQRKIPGDVGDGMKACALGLQRYGWRKDDGESQCQSDALWQWRLPKAG